MKTSVQRPLPPSAKKWPRKDWDAYRARMAALKSTPEALARARARYHAKMDWLAEESGIPRRSRGRQCIKLCTNRMVGFVPGRVLWVS